MKKYVIQMRSNQWAPWTVVREFDTLVEARRAYEALPIKVGYRIAEAYVQIRYKPVK